MRGYELGGQCELERGRDRGLGDLLRRGFWGGGFWGGGGGEGEEKIRDEMKSGRKPLLDAEVPAQETEVAVCASFSVAFLLILPLIDAHNRIDIQIEGNMPVATSLEGKLADEVNPHAGFALLRPPSPMALDKLSDTIF